MKIKITQLCSPVLRGLLSIMLLALLSATAYSQVTGTIFDENNSPLVGASVIVEGKTGVGALSDVEGHFSLAAKKGDILLISFVGYDAQRLTVSTETVLSINLQPQAALNEVVVVGYGAVKKRDLTGSVGSANIKEILQATPTNISQALQGRLAGVLVQKNDGAPGAGVSIQVRGANSFSSNTEPLYVIDGIPFSSGGGASSGIVGGGTDGTSQNANPLSFLNPNDIESIEILKDASATAIYGSRGANGVVLIRTKKGAGEGQNSLEFVANFGVSAISRKIKMANAYQYASYMNEGTVNGRLYEGRNYDRLPFPGLQRADTIFKDNINRVGIEKITPFYEPKPEDYQTGLTATLYNDLKVENFTGTDWQDQIFRNALTKDYSLTYRGSNRDGWYSVSANMLNQDGIIENSNYNRYSVRAGINHKFNNWITIESNTSFTKASNNFVPTNSGSGSGSSLQGILRTALVYVPTNPLFDPTENPAKNNELFWLMANPSFYVRNLKNDLSSNQIFSSNSVELQLLPSLKFKQNIGFNYNLSEREQYYGRLLPEGREPRNGLAGNNSGTWYSTTLESLLSFDKELAKNHRFSAVAGATREFWTYKYFNASASNFPDDLTQSYNFKRGAQNTYLLESGRSEGGIISFLGRANYDFKGKYLATASYRRDGTTNFAANHKWSNFYSFALGWRISEEKVIKDLGLFDDLKLRVGYGQTGNQSIGPYQTLDQLQPLNGVLNGSQVPGLVEGYRPGNPDLFWETTNQYNAGIDAAFFKNRLNITVDAYQKKTINLLTDEQTPPSSGFTTKYKNAAFITNKGLEFSFNAYMMPSNMPLQWILSGNISSNVNRIGGLESDQYANDLYYNVNQLFLRRNGLPIGIIYGLKTDGFYDNIAEVVADPSKAGLSEASQRELVGEIKYLNTDSDPTKINEKDRVIIGNTNPDFTFGLNNTFTYKNFNFSFFVQGVQGNDILNANLFDLVIGDVRNIPEDAYTYRWTPQTTATAKYPKAWRTERRERRITDRDVEDGSYIRLKNVNLGYTFKSPFKGLAALNIYVNASNLWTSTKYSWYDPDVNGLGSGGGRRGVDINSYPNARSVNAGLKATF
jgi:TonB-linked SusC/RagA family outer membrane protein